LYKAEIRYRSTSSSQHPTTSEQNSLAINETCINAVFFAFQGLQSLQNIFKPSDMDLPDDLDFSRFWYCSTL